jgi:hypothetical protein
MSAPLVINLRDGSAWERRAVSPEGVALYALAGSCKCPEFLMATEAELAAQGIAGTADVLPVPVGPGRLPFPPEPRSEEERLRMQVVDLEDQLAQATKAAARALRERDLIRERVSEPFGCKYCGEAKRFHGRRYLSGMDAAHSWERPSDEQVKDRMLARRAARFTSYVGRLACLLVARTEDLLGVEARVAELLDERHVTNEALDDAIQALRQREQQDAVVAEFVADRAEYITAIRNCRGRSYDYDRWQGHAAARRQLAEKLGLPVAWPPEDAVSLERSADRLTALLAPTQVLREDADAEAGERR